MSPWKSAGQWLAVFACVAATAWGLAEREQAASAGSAAIASAFAPSNAPVLRFPRDPSSRTITLDAALARQALRDGELRVALADGTSFPVRMERQYTDASGHWHVVGRVQTPHGREAMVLTFGPDAVFGVVPMPDGQRMQVTTGPRGDVSIATAGGMVPEGQPGLAVLPDYIVPAPMPAPSADTQGRARAADQSIPVDAPMSGPGVVSTPARQTAASIAAAAAPDTTPVHINVLALYAPGLVTLRGSVAAAETEVANLFALANQAHLDSGSRVRLTAVGLRALGIPATHTNQQALETIATGRYFDVDIEALRDAHQADLVTLIRPHLADDPQCGHAFLPGAAYTGTNQLRAELGYTVVNVAPCGPYVLAHELGHAMGLVHDRETQTDKYGNLTHGAYAYSFGYRTRSFGTIMADVQDRTWLGRFSGPERGCNGMPCGIAERIDGVRSLNFMAPAIASFRHAPNTAWVSDVASVEARNKTVSVPIRLSMPAPPDGLVFQVQLVGGSATAFSDYRADTSSSTIRVMGGQRSAVFNMILLTDDVVEGDETVLFRLVPPAGVVVSNADATVTILDDDPRPVITGRVRMPEGVTLTYPPRIQAYGINGSDGRAFYENVDVKWDDYTYAIKVTPGAPIQLVTDLGTDRAFPRRAALPEVWESRTLDVDVDAAVELRGKIHVAPGMVKPPTYDLGVMHYVDGELVKQYASSLDQEGNYVVRTIPGATLELSSWHGLTPTTGNTVPFAVWRAIVQHVREPATLDVVLSSVPSVVARVPGRVDEGQPVTVEFYRWAMYTVAPVQFRWRTVDGTAIAGQDYVAATGVATIPGDGASTTIQIATKPESTNRGARYFDVVMDQFVGGTAPTPVARVWITDDDARSSAPLTSYPH